MQANSLHSSSTCASLEIARIVQPHAAAHDMLGTIAGQVEDSEHGPDRLMRLGHDASHDHDTIQHGHLARDEQPAIRAHCAGERQLPGIPGSRQAMALDVIHDALPR